MNSDIQNIIMKGRIVIKLGGSLITNKEIENTIYHRRIESIGEIIFKLVHEEYSIILIHGAGSFGHILARKWKIADGASEEIISKQRENVDIIRRNMIQLNNEIITIFSKLGIESVGYPPSKWASGIGENFDGDLSFIGEHTSDSIPILFGDVVDIHNIREFGILSGDDIMARVCREIPNVTHAIFLIGDAPGVMSKPPHYEDSKLIPVWNKKTNLEIEHKSHIDVTGGMELKLLRASSISEKVNQVWFLDGRESERILDLLANGKTIGTKIEN